MKTAKQIVENIQNEEEKNGRAKTGKSRISRLMGSDYSTVYSYANGRRRFTPRARAHMLALELLAESDLLYLLEKRLEDE